MDRQGGDIIPEIAVSPISSTRRVEKKGRKWNDVQDLAWEETLRENLEKVGVKASEALKNVDEFQSGRVALDVPGDVPVVLGDRLTINSEEEFETVIKDIRKLADNPEKLVESHLKVFIEPVANGKWVNSQG
jgi:hypothetical protein